jgi:hypothetical protein
VLIGLKGGIFLQYQIRSKLDLSSCCIKILIMDNRKKRKWAIVGQYYMFKSCGGIVNHLLVHWLVAIEE